MTDYPDWTVPQAHANTIAATGVPLLTKSNRLYQQAFINVGAGVAVHAAVGTVSQIGYEVIFTAQCDPAATNPFVKVQLTWTDSVSGTVVAQDVFKVPMSTAVGGFKVVGRGPSKADILDIFMDNDDTLTAPSFSLIVLQNSRIYAFDDWFWDNAVDNGMTVPGFTLASLPSDQNVLGMINNVAIGAGANTTWLFGMRTGPAQLYLATAVGALTAVTIKIRPQPDSLYTSTDVILSQATPAQSTELVLPRAPLRVNIANTSGASITIAAMLITER